MEYLKTINLIDNEIADRISKFSKNSQQNNLETVTNENDKEVPKERYVSSEDRQKIIDNLRFTYKSEMYNNGISKNMNLLDNMPNQPTKFRTKNWIETNDDARGTYSTNSQIKFKISMLKSNLCDYSDAYILVKGTITVAQVLAPAAPDNVGKEVVFKNCAPFTDCISEINNTQLDNSKDIDELMRMYNLIEFSDKYSKTSGSL